MDQVFSFLLWPKREARGPWKQGRKKRGSITCPTDWANEANKMFIIWLCWLFRFWKGDRELEVRTATYGPGIDQSQHAKSVGHIIKYRTVTVIFKSKRLRCGEGWTSKLKPNSLPVSTKTLKRTLYLNNSQAKICKALRELFEAAASKPPPEGIGHFAQVQCIQSVNKTLFFSYPFSAIVLCVYMQVSIWFCK